MKPKTMWVVWNHEDTLPYCPVKAVFKTALECKRAVDKCRPLDHEQWPGAKGRVLWKTTKKTPKNRLMWFREDGWIAERFDVGVLEK